jgi:hypothetical protein
MRKDRPPGVMPPDVEQAFERAVGKLGRLPPELWDDAVGLWQQLPNAPAPTRARLLLRLYRRCEKLNQRLAPWRLVDAMAEELKLKVADLPRPRSDARKMQKAAKHLVHNPGAGARAIGKVIDTTASTVQAYFERPAFWAACAEETLKFDDERAVPILWRYIERFGPPTFKTGLLPLRFVVPLMLDALESGHPIKPEDVKHQRERYRDGLSEALLRQRLLPLSLRPKRPRGQRDVR